MPGECSDPVARVRARLRVMFDRHDHRCVDCGVIFFCACEFLADETDDVCPTCEDINDLLADELTDDAAACAAAMPDAQ
jgi:hypothetical protein